MTRHLKRWAWGGVRLAVIAAALGYIVWKVDWQDQATLKAGSRKVKALDVEKDSRGVERRVLVELTPPLPWYRSIYEDAHQTMTGVSPEGTQRVWLDESQLVRPPTKI